MSPYATIALLALVLSVAAQNNVAPKTTVNVNANWNKQANQAIGNVNVNGKTTPFTVSVSGNSNQQPTFTIQSQDPAGKTTTVKIIPIKPITSSIPPQTKPADLPKPVHQDVPVPIQSAAPMPPIPTPATIPMPAPVPTPEFSPAPAPPKPVVTTVRTSTFTVSEPNKPVVTVRSQTISNNNEKPVTVTVISVAKPEPIKGDPNHFIHPTPNSVPHPTPMPPQPVNTVATAVVAPEPYVLSAVNCEFPENRHHPECRDNHREEKRKGCNRRLWIKGCILGLAAFGALAFLALCCRICCRRSDSCCCRRRHPDCERNPTYGIPAPVPMNAVGQPQQVFVVQAHPVDPYYQPSPNNTNRTAQPFVQLNETHPDTSANYVIGYPQSNEQPIYMIPQRN